MFMKSNKSGTKELEITNYMDAMTKGSGIHDDWTVYAAQESTIYKETGWRSTKDLILRMLYDEHIGRPKWLCEINEFVVRNETK